jgi:DNA-binding transcriptional MerR regulator
MELISRGEIIKTAQAEGIKITSLTFDYYIKEGLFPPPHKKTGGTGKGVKAYYSPRILDMLRGIDSYKKEGLTLRQIKNKLLRKDLIESLSIFIDLHIINVPNILIEGLKTETGSTLRNPHFYPIFVRYYLSEEIREDEIRAAFNVDLPENNQLKRVINDNEKAYLLYFGIVRAALIHTCEAFKKIYGHSYNQKRIYLSEFFIKSYDESSETINDRLAVARALEDFKDKEIICPSKYKSKICKEAFVQGFVEGGITFFDILLDHIDEREGHAQSLKKRITEMKRELEALDKEAYQV